MNKQFLSNATLRKTSFGFIQAFIAFSFLGIQSSAKAASISYNLSWEGDAGYSMTGMFSFDNELIPSDGIIREDQLESMMISFFDPAGSLLEKFTYDFPNPDTSGEFTFNFDTATETVIQSGFPLGPTGLDLGIDNSSGVETGLDFYSCRGDGAVENGECLFSFLGEGIVLQENLAPSACFNGPDDPNCADIDGGGVVIAERVSVPEPSKPLTILGTVSIIAFGTTFKRKFNQSNLNKSLKG